MLTTGCEDAGGAPTSPTRPTTSTSVAISGPGCYRTAYAGREHSQFGCGILASSGDPYFDRVFNEEVVIQRNFFTSPARVYLFDECEASRANAISHPQRFILFGVHMANKLISEAGGNNLPVAAVLAHEYAHQLQFRYNWINRNAPTVRDAELEADAFAGYYGALEKSWTGSRLEAFYRTVFNIGDFNFHDRNHHGTPNQRLAAAYLGYETARMNRGYSWSELHEIFTHRITTEVISRRVTVEVTDLSPNAQDGIARGDSELVKAVASGERDLRGL